MRIADTFAVTTDYLLRGKDNDIRIRPGSLTPEQVDAIKLIIDSMQVK